MGGIFFPIFSALPAVPQTQTFKGEFTVDGNSVSSAQKGTYTNKKGKTIVSTDEQVDEYAKHIAAYDGPTEFKGTYEIVVNAKGEVDPAKCTVLFTTVYYTSSGKKRKSGFQTLPITITAVMLNADMTSVMSFAFASNDWYPNLKSQQLVNAGLSGDVDFGTKKANWLAAYQDMTNAVLCTYKVVGTVK